MAYALVALALVALAGAASTIAYSFRLVTWLKELEHVRSGSEVYAVAGKRHYHIPRPLLAVYREPSADDLPPAAQPPERARRPFAWQLAVASIGACERLLVTLRAEP